MVRLLSSNKGEKGDEQSLMGRMTLGSKFNEDGSLLKNIHSFLKPKKRYSVSEISLQDEHMEDPWVDTEGISECEYQEDISTPSSSMDFSHSGSESPVPAIQRSVSTLTDPRIGQGSSPIASFDNGNHADIDFMVEDLLDQPLGNHRSLRRSNSSNHASHSPCRRPMGHFRHSSLNVSRKERKSLRGPRTSLRRMSTVDSPAKDVLLPKLQVKTAGAAKPIESKISKSQIPYYHNENINSDNYPRITAETLQRIIEEKIYRPQYDSYCIIDCRFEYEFKGGHINNALNVCSREDLELEFIQAVRTEPTLLIFYCEFSAYRSPLMASHLRNCDRIFNAEEYPNLFYPDIIILEGGYKSFFDLYPHLCYPCSYVRMDSSENLSHREQQLDRFRQDSKKLVSRNSSRSRLTSMSSSSISSAKKTQQEPLHPERTTSTPSLLFKYDAPPKLSLSKYGNSPFLSSDESTMSSRISFTNSPNLGSSRLLAADTLDVDSCYSFEDGDSTFTTPQNPLSTPTLGNFNGYKNDIECHSLNPVKKSLFPNILLEEENEIGE
ncbi:MIH1 (YMR036C) [Zygosaccharomyces parabailii]|nr:MIH1 (YMR036C) [Zygosaccharomyces parabailii]CDH16735.1 uncharacterized protein ZBAI_08523 [Zygosaccharomyces bailii ISA1307]SJM88608.1 uncharacterized protein ZBIST_4797 [Zygosaccharomyces bailii]